MRGLVAAGGAGFLWSWLYCLWFSRSDIVASSVLTSDDGTWLVSMVLAAATQILLLLKRDKVKPVLLNPGTMLLVGVLMAVLSLMFCLGSSLLSSNILWIVCIANGLLSGTLWTAWGFSYDAIDVASFRRAVPLSAILVLPCMGLCMVLSGVAQAAVIAALPIASAIFLIWMRRMPWVVRPNMELADENAKKARSTALNLGGIVFSIGAVLYFSLVVLLIDSQAGAGDGAAGIMVGSGVVALLAFVLLGKRFKQTGTTFLNWLVWFAIVALALSSYSVHLSSFLLNVAGFGVDFLVILYFALIANRGYMATSTAFIVGESLVELGFALGYALGFLASTATDASLLPLWIALALGCMALLLMRLLGQQSNIEFLSMTSRLGMSSKENADRIAKSFALSKRETEVLSYLAQGRTVVYISDALFISTNTVDTHVKHIYAKLGIHSKQELIDMVSSDGDCSFS